MVTGVFTGIQVGSFVLIAVGDLVVGALVLVGCLVVVGAFVVVGALEGRKEVGERVEGVAVGFFVETKVGR